MIHRDPNDVIGVRALVEVQEQSYAQAGPSLASSWPRESAMGAETLGAFLHERRYCVLATVNRQGHPVARPVAFTPFAGSFWFATVRGARLRNLQRTPWASVVIEDGDRGSHRAVAVDGRVLLTDEPSTQVVELWERRHRSRPDWAAAWFELQPRRLVSYAAANTS
jgi:nitroimidazol reductase NimA-like FMN-containing flavoprotein (pyridoxamine 5'-phosphate oxidase superfamily)